MPIPSFEMFSIDDQSTDYSNLEKKQNFYKFLELQSEQEQNKTTPAQNEPSHRKLIYETDDEDEKMNQLLVNAEIKANESLKKNRKINKTTFANSN